jgi:AcrR family transcriptional regulator
MGCVVAIGESHAAIVGDNGSAAAPLTERAAVDARFSQGAIVWGALTDRLVSQEIEALMVRPAQQKQQTERPAPAQDQEMRSLILTNAADLFLAKGYRGVSMKMIADAVEVTSAALYYYFPDGKEDLFTAMVQTVFVGEGLTRIEEPLAEPRGFREGLTQLTSALVALPLDERLSLLLRDAREHLEDPDHQKVILSLLHRIRRQITDLFQHAQEAGEIRADLPVNVLVSLYVGMLREGKDSRADRAAVVVRVLLDGIAKGERSPLP